MNVRVFQLHAYRNILAGLVTILKNICHAEDNVVKNFLKYYLVGVVNSIPHGVDISGNHLL